MKSNLKKAMFLGFVLMICALFATTAMAVNESGAVPAPKDFEGGVLADGEVCFSWKPAEGAVKYSVAIEVTVDLGDDTFEVHEFDFGSNDYELVVLGDEMSMCIPLDEIAVDTDDDDILDKRLSGPATAKIKGLDPGKNKGRQNNEFSYPLVYFTLPE